jgi:hypothetical protein
MTERYSSLEAALERVVDAARAHLVAAREHLTVVGGAPEAAEDPRVWQSYVELNNASIAYDDLLQDTLGETTPWNVEAIDPDQVTLLADRARTPALAPASDDPHPRVISVRQRRDYRIPSVSALLRAGNAARGVLAARTDEPELVVTSPGEAMLELMQVGDGSLGSLDVPELEPLDGVVVVAEVHSALDPAMFSDVDGSGPFVMREGDQLVERVDEHAFVEFDAGDHPE